MLWFLLLLIVVSSILFSVIASREHYSPDPKFVSKQYIYDVIDKSPFFNNMSPIDLVARGADSAPDYKSIYINHVIEFTSTEKRRLTEITKDFPHLQNIPWKFAKVSDRIENAYPHTLQDVIILPASFFKKNDNTIKTTLVHEKIHVYQRLFPKETLALLTSLGFKQTSEELPENISKMKRNNPDIQGVFHFNSTIPIQVYNSVRPSSLADSKTILYDYKQKAIVDDDGNFIPYYINQKEHPYEIMAVLLPKILLGEQHKDNMFKTAIQWCQEYIIR